MATKSNKELKKKAAGAKQAAEVAQWNCYVEEGEAMIYGVERWLCAKGDLEIPETLDGCPVTLIGQKAFKNCSGLTSVKIPASVTRIGGDAFERCRESLFDKTTIPGVKLVDGWVVGHGGSLSGDLNLAGVRGIMAKVFYNCRELKSVTIPGSVTRIGEYAFKDCTGLASATLPKHLEGDLPDNAFEGCSADLKIIYRDAAAPAKKRRTRREMSAPRRRLPPTAT